MSLEASGGGELPVQRSSPRIPVDPQGHVTSVDVFLPGHPPHTVVVSPKGFLDAVNASYIGELLESCASSGYNRVVFDFGQLPTTRAVTVFSDLAGFRRRLRSLGGDLVLTGLHAAQRENLDLLGLSRVLPVAQSVEDARKILGDPPR